jgi:methylglutaconyl-CoA hydratase
LPVLTAIGDDGLARVTLARADARNALDAEAIAALTRAYDEFGANPRVRAIVLTGEGKAFCSGMDLILMQRQVANGEAENLRDAERFADMLRAVYECPKPTVTRVQGDAYAAGVGLMAASDIVIAVGAAKFAITEAKLGIVPGVIGPYLVNAIGARAAKRLSLTAEVFTAGQARDLGLVHDVVVESDLDSTVDRIGSALIANAPQALAKIKRLFQTFEPGPVTGEVRAFTARTIAEARASDEAQEGFAAFFAKRKPQWPTK